MSRPVLIDEIHIEVLVPHALAGRDLAALIPTRRPVYLWGPPCVGISSLVRQATDQLGVGLVDIRSTLLDPVDLRGLPRHTGDAAVWLPPAFLPRRGEGVSFLDELGHAPPLVQAPCLQLTLDSRVGEYQWPAGWSVVAASNRAGTHRPISPLLNRFVATAPPAAAKPILWAQLRALGRRAAGRAVEVTCPARAAVADGRVRGRVPAGLRVGARVGAGAAGVLRLLQRRAATPVARVQNTRRGIRRQRDECRRE